LTAQASSPPNRRLDLAARAAWLYFVCRRTQDEIAAELNVSRQNAQRLVALATTEGLIKFRLDYPLAECIELAERLRDRFGLIYCDVVPSEREPTDPIPGIAIAAAEQLENYLSQREPVVLALGTGRTMRAAVGQVPLMDRPQHKIVSVVGTLTRDGRASPYDVVMRLSDRVGAQCYPVPIPVVADDEEERARLQAQRWHHTVRSLVDQARAVFIGIGEIGRGCPLHADGFVTDRELGELVDRGAIGEILSWSFNRDGILLTEGVNRRITAVPPPFPADRPTIIVGAGPAKVAPIRAALTGRLANGLITDEATALRAVVN
jgi:DNA-binding transcriptional regulator LsrR (DeoR family)